MKGQASLLRQTLSRWIDHEGHRLGAALAFYSLLSLATTLILMFWFPVCWRRLPPVSLDRPTPAPQRLRCILFRSAKVCHPPESGERGSGSPT